MWLNLILPQVENDPVCIASYIQFLAVHTADDDLASLGVLVQDMATLIVGLYRFFNKSLIKKCTS